MSTETKEPICRCHPLGIMFKNCPIHGDSAWKAQIKTKASILPETKREELKPCPFCGENNITATKENTAHKFLLFQHRSNCYFINKNKETWNTRTPEPQSSSLTFNDGVTAMTRHSLAAVKLVESGRWTVVRMKEWLTACLTQDIKFLTDELKANSHPNPTTETNSWLDEIVNELGNKIGCFLSPEDEWDKDDSDATAIKFEIKQALLIATEQMRKENEELSQILDDCKQVGIQEANWRIKAESERDLAQQRLVKLAGLAQQDDYYLLTEITDAILSGNFETIDKII